MKLDDGSGPVETKSALDAPALYLRLVQMLLRFLWFSLNAAGLAGSVT